MDFWDKLANPNAKTEAEATPGVPKPKTEGRDWLDDAIDRQGLGDQRDFVRSVFAQESSSGKANTSKPNDKGARGPMQVREIAFRDVQQRGYIPKDYRWDNPEHSAEAGVAYLKHAIKTHGGDTRKAAAFYFGGPDAVRKDGTIEMDRSDGRMTVREYIDKTHSNTKAGAPRAEKTSAQAGAAKIPKWSDIVQSPQFAALNTEEREQLRAEYRNEALPKAVGPDQLAELQAAFDENTQLSFFDHARLTLKQTGAEIAEGGRGATQGLRGRSLAQDMKRVEEHKAAAAAARAAGDETTAEQYDAAAAAALSEAKVADKEIAASNKSSTFVARSSVQRMLDAKTADDAWGAFKSDPLNVIAGITAQSAAAMAPGLVFAALAGGGIPGAVMMGANSAMMENGSSLLDFAAENGVDAKSEGALVKFYSDPENLRAGLSYAGTRATIIGMADAATGGIASKTIAPKALKSAVAKQFVNVPTQMAVQAGGGAAGEAGAQLATKGEIDAPGQVLAEAVGELATAPADVAVLAKDSISSKEPGSKSAGLRNLAKRLRGEPVDAGAVVDNPTEGAQVPALAPRGVAGAPIPDDTGIVTREVREKINVTPDMVLDKGDAGPGNRPALPPPGGTGGTPTQSEIRVDGAGNATKVQVDRTVRQIGNEPGLTGGMRVDSAGNVSMETGPQAMEAEQERLRREDLGISPVSVPSKPAIPKKARSKTKSLRSEYSANQALADRAAPGWKSPTGKTIEEVLRARPRPQEEPKPTPQRKKLFGLFSKRGITKSKGGAYVAPAERAAEPNFKRWFGGSKAKQGVAPQVYFHGTAADIESFRPQQAGAIFLSPSPDFAASFAHASLEHVKKNLPKIAPEAMAKVDERAREMVRKNYEEQGVDEETLNYYLDNVRMTDEWLYASMDALDSGPNILPVFVRAERPFDGSNPEHAARVARHLSAGKGVFTLQSNQWTEDDLAEALDRGDWTVLESPEVQAAIKALGHDSFYVTEGGQKNLAVYNPNQIKSAVGNIKFGEGDNIVASRKTKEKTNAAEPTGARGDDARAVRGSQEQVAGDSRPDQGDVRVLEGAPGAIDIPGRGRVTFGLWDRALDVAKSYAKRAGIQFKPLTDWKKVDKERAARVAAEYAAMAHAPGDPQVAAAYAAMIKETSAQYEEILKSGLKVEFIRGADPYAASPRLAVLDMTENNHLWVFSTRDGFGSNATFDPKDNPLLAETKFEISGEKALANDIFRVVHDYFGHAMYGAGFRADGEENAWRAHSQMYSPQARRAMTTETRGQNSWVNFGPHGEKNRSASGSETVYADQKTGLLPAWVMHDGAPQDGEQIKAAPATKSIATDGDRGMSVEDVTKIVDSFSAANKGANKLDIYVVQSAEEVEGLPSGVEGVYVGEDGSVILVADSLNPKRAAEVIAHEIVGHHGVESIIAAAGPGFERRWIEILKDVARVRAKGGYASMENVRQEYGDNQLIGAMEVLARMAETGEKHSLLTKAVSLIRDALRKLGINLRMSDSDLIELITRARGAVARGENISNAETKAWHAKLMSMSDEAAAGLMSEKPEVQFYSALARAVKEINSKAMSASDWVKRISALKGVKPDELKWSGVLDWLAVLGTHRVSRDEIEKYLEENGVQIKEVVLGQEGRAKPLKWSEWSDPQDDENGEQFSTTPDGYRMVRGVDGFIDVYYPDGEYLREGVNGEERAKEFAERDADESFSGRNIEPTKFSKYTLPGGQNYRELLLTLPEPPPTSLGDVARELFGPSASMSNITAEQRREVHSKWNALPSHKKESFSSPHWEQSNVLAHVRFNERTDADGKRVLFIEEIQSDWAQQGKKAGFKKEGAQGEYRKLAERYNSIEAELMAIPHESEATEEQLAAFDRLAEEQARVQDEMRELQSTSRIPPAPFVTSTDAWVELALKRMIMLAVEGGYDRVAFISGQQSADRYDLSKQVSRVEWVEPVSGDLRQVLRAYGPSGNLVVSERMTDIAMAEDYIGKELAQRLANTKPVPNHYGTPVRTLSGVDLRVGGEGMKTFYDKIVPSAVNRVLKKLGGGKMVGVPIKMGAKYKGYVDFTVGPRTIGDGDAVMGVLENGDQVVIDQNGDAQAKVEELRRNLREAQGQLGFDITPEMRKSALGGLPLFSKKRWSTENAAFEVAPGGNAAIKGEWDKLPLARRAEITLALSKAIVPAVAELFTSAKATVQATVGGWMGDVNPSVALKLPSASTVEAQRIAAAVAYVFDQDAGLHVSAKGAQDAIVVELADGQDGEALYKSLPGNKKEFIGFTSSGDGMMEFLVDDAAKSLPKLQAHFGPAKVSVAQRGFSFLDKKDYKAARDSLPEADQDALDGLRDQARALMRISLSPERTGTQISTAPVTATAERTWLDPMKQRITVGIDHILGLGPKGVQIHAELMAKMANIRPKPGRTPAETIEAAVEHFKSNILWLYDQTLPAVRERAKLWYVGGNKIARQMSKFYGISPEQGAALIAVLSPQRDWFVNVSLARRVLDIWKHRQDFTATHEMFMAAVADRTQQSADARATQIKLANRIAGKKLSELSNPLEAAVWIRSFDEAYNARTYRAISPEGETLGLAMNDDGETPASVQWGSNGTIAAAVSVLRDGSMENISTQLGSGHKVRNFYTNLIDPSDPSAITVDTHAVGVATLRPMSSDSEEVKNAFGGNTKGERGPVTSTIIGSNGTYGIFAEAYRRAAAERGILPREMQSITWEAVRGMFRAADKRTTSAPVEALWNQYKRGRMTLDRVREELKEVADADGINAPSWTAAHHQLDEDEQGAHEDLGLSGAGRDGGAGSGEPVAQGPRRRLGLHSVAATGGGSGVVEFSRRKPAPGSVSVDAWHWSHGQLSELSGFMYGQGIRGAEAERLSGAPEEIRRRVYFYTQRDNGTIPLREGGLGPNRHEVRLANLWKSGISPSIKVEPVGWTQSGIFIRDEAGTRNAWEMALLKAGYDGYVDGLSGVAVVLNSDVPVQFVRAAGLQSRATQTPANASPAARTGLLDGAFKLGMGWVGRLLSGPAYDYLIRQGARIVPDRVKHGLVSDFGLEGMYLDAKIDRTAAVNKVLRETKNLLDSLAGLTREQSRVAYLWMAEKPDTELEQQLLAQIPADDRATLRNMKSLIDMLGREAVSVGLLTPDSYERNKMAYLHRIYEAHMKPGAAGAAAKRAAAIRAENFKGRGIRHDVKADALVQAIDEIKEGDLLDRWEARSPSGKVTAVRYVKHGAAGPKGYTKADTWEARWLDRPGNKVGLWRDMTAEERHKLGEIEEVRFAFAKTVINGIRDIENAKFLKWVAEKYATEDAPADKIIGDPSTGYWATQAFKPDEFVRVPDTEIAGTKLKKYGALAGKIIPAPVWNDIRNQMARPADATSAAWDALVRNWKLSKTALSPAVHTNNVMSNFVMADLAEVRARDLVKAMRAIVAAKRGDAAAKALIDRFEDSGADYGSFANIELSQLYIEPLLAELEKVENNELGLLKASQIVNLAMQGHVLTAGKAAMEKAAWVKKPFELMMRAYQSEDSVFRLAKFMREIEAGKPDREAGKAARDSFLDYNINAPWIQAARRSVLPFIAFSYRAIPMMLNAAAHKPWKFAKYLAVGYALNAAAYAMLGLGGDDEDRERKLLPDELDGRLLGVFPRLIRMPWNDAHGSPVFLDARRWVPGGDMVDLNQSQAALPVPSWLSVSGPLSIMMEFFSNKSSFTGREIVKDTDTKGEAMAKVVDHLFKAFAPNLPLPGPGTVIPGTDRGQLQTYAWTGLLDAGTGRTDAFGRDQSLATAALSSVGVKARAYPEDALRLRAVQEFQQAQREIQNNIKGLARELSRNGISQQEFDRRVEREKQKLEKASETLRKKL